MKKKRIISKIIVVIVCFTIVLTLFVVPCFANYQGSDCDGDGLEYGNTLIPNLNLGLPWEVVFKYDSVVGLSDTRNFISSSSFNSLAYTRSYGVSDQVYDIASSTGYSEALSPSNVPRNIAIYNNAVFGSGSYPSYESANKYESYAVCCGGSYTYINNFRKYAYNPQFLSLYTDYLNKFGGNYTSERTIDGAGSVGLFYDGIIDINILSDSSVYQRSLPEDLYISYLVDYGSFASTSLTPIDIHCNITFRNADNSHNHYSDTEVFTSEDLASSIIYHDVVSGDVNSFISLAYQESDFSCSVVTQRLSMPDVYALIVDYVNTYAPDVTYISDLSIEFTAYSDIDVYPDLYEDNEFLSSYVDFLGGKLPVVSLGLNGNQYCYDACESMKGYYSGALPDGAKSYHEIVSLEEFNIIDWLGDTLGGIMNTRIIGPITIATVLYVAVGVGFVMLVLKFFAGG